MSHFNDKKAEAVRDLADHFWGVVTELKSRRFQRLKRISFLTTLARDLTTASEEMERAFCQERVYDLGAAINRSRDDIQEHERRIERLKDERGVYLEKYPNLYIGKRPKR